jgi:hypothetical protein
LKTFWGSLLQGRCLAKGDAASHLTLKAMFFKDSNP